MRKLFVLGAISLMMLVVVLSGCQLKCSDGTLYGQCSSEKPQLCDDGQLVDRCDVCGCPAGQACQGDGSCAIEAYFMFDYPPSPETFVIKLTDPTKIQTARDIIAGRIKVGTHIGGLILKQNISYNPQWSYHLNESSIYFFDNAVEVCDASILYVEDHLQEACGVFLPSCRWCPWGSRLLSEVNP